MSESSEDFREFNFDVTRHDEAVAEKRKLYEGMSFWNQTPDRPRNDPKYWMSDKTIPKSVVVHPNPNVFLSKYVQPMLAEFAKAIALARSTKQQIRIGAWIQLERTNEAVQKSPEKDAKETSGIGQKPEKV